MSAPATISSAQTSALQGLRQRTSQAAHGAGVAAQPSQLQVSFANLISSLHAGSGAASQAATTTQVDATAGGASAVSGNTNTDLTSLIESLLANNGSAASNVLQTATEPQDAAKSQLGHHHHYHAGAQVSGASNSGSNANSATSAYTAMQSQTTTTNAVSAQA